jgi:hypothetical protein
MSSSAHFPQAILSAAAAAARLGPQEQASFIIPDDPIDDHVFSQVLGSFQEQHHRQGYSEGYQRAISDILTASLTGIEDFLHQESGCDGADPRQVLYRFHRFLETRLLSASGRGEFVSEGLGI